MIGGKVMVLGLRKKDWPDLRTQTNRLVIVSSDFEALRRQQKAGVPKGVEAVVMTKFISHSNTRFLDEAKDQGVRVYPVMGTGEARKLVIELLHGIRVREAVQAQRPVPLPPPLLVAPNGAAIKRADGATASEVMLPAADKKEDQMPSGSGPTLGEFLPGVGRAKSKLRIWVDGQVDGRGSLRDEAKRLIPMAHAAGLCPADYSVGAMQNMVARGRRAKGLASGPARGGRRAQKTEAPAAPPARTGGKAGLAGQLRAMAQGLEHLAKDVEQLEAFGKELARFKRLLK